MWAYLLASLPNAIVLVLALLLGLFPKWVTDLEQRSRLRWLLAGSVASLAIVIWILSAMQTHASDVALDSLREQQQTGFSALDQHISTFEARTPTVSKLSVHVSNEETSIVQRGGVWLAGLNVTLNNDGDDLTYTNHYVAAIGDTPSLAGQMGTIKTIRRKLKLWGDKGPRAVLRHGESHATSAIIPLSNQNDVSGIMAGTETAFFGFVFDLKTTTGKHGSVVYCGFYQGMMVVECPDPPLGTRQ